MIYRVWMLNIEGVMVSVDVDAPNAAVATARAEAEKPDWRFLMIEELDEDDG